LTALRQRGIGALGQRGLNDARFIGQLSPDYKYRKQQAANGALAAAAELEQAEHDVTQAVVWTYYSTVYAREQVKVAKDAVDFVDYYRDQVDQIGTDKKGGTKEINPITLNELIIRLAEGKRLLIKARAGEQKAHAALKEAMGVETDFGFEVADTKLPDFAKFELNKDLRSPTHERGAAK
jgi:outer membrane protein TolC